MDTRIFPFGSSSPSVVEHYSTASARNIMLRSLLMSSAILAASAMGAIVTPFADDYTQVNLGSVSGVPTNYGGLTFKAGDPNTLLLGGAANTGSGAIYQVGVTRGGDGHITGFSAPATLFATAPNIDGGLTYGPSGVLFYTGYSNNILGQIKPGSTSPDKVINLSDFGVASSVGTVQYVPNGFGGAGSLKVGSYSGGTWYELAFAPDGSGTYNILSATLSATTGGGPEGLVYVAAGNPEFAVDSVLISEYGSGAVAAYEIDASGNPIASTRRDFLTGLTGAEGATIDPLTGDFLFSTFGGGNDVVLVRGFVSPVPEPSTLGTLGAGLLAVGLLRRRRS